MGTHYQPILTFLSLLVVTSHAALSPEDYWKSVLPNTPMPEGIKNILPPADWQQKSSFINPDTVSKNLKDRIRCRKYRYFDKSMKDLQLQLDPRENSFFLEKDMKQGRMMNIQFTKSTTTNKAMFLPQQLAESIPFSSKKTPEILKEFIIEPNSPNAKTIKDTLELCEDPGVKDEQKYCATSLESMINFCTSKIGKDVQVLSANVDKENRLKSYRISKVTKVGDSDQTIVCHKLTYAYAVFGCHKLPSTKAYVVSLDDVDGKQVTAVAVCHEDTSTWNPGHISFQLLKVKPGSVPICHFLEAYAITWVPN